MIHYSLLPNTLIQQTHEKVKDHLPDLLQDPVAFIAMFNMRNSMFFEIGDFGGVFWLSDVFLGWKANGHMVIWDKKFRGQHERAKEIMCDVFRMLRLQRLQSFIPVQKRDACIYAERLGFTLEGVLRKFDYYNEVLEDVALYSLLAEEL